MSRSIQWSNLRISDTLRQAILPSVERLCSSQRVLEGVQSSGFLVLEVPLYIGGVFMMDPELSQVEQRYCGIKATPEIGSPQDISM